MAAAILAIKKRNKEGRGKRRSILRPNADGESPEWAKQCVCWNSFWSRTNIDEKFWSLQPTMSKLYAHPKSQAFIAAVIMGNFMCNIVQKEIDPGEYLYSDTFYIFECIFNVIFAIELAINLYAHWFWKFVKSGWNWFDVLVVTVGLMSMAKLTEGPLTLLRNLRAFRVFRLFKRIKSLNKILKALARAVPGVTNAFFVVLLVMCIYAILAVEFFRLVGVNEDHLIEHSFLNGNVSGSAIVEFTSPRGLSFGEEYFGTFTKALYTLFQLLLGDSWSEVVTRTLMFGASGLVHPVTCGLFFVSFMIINAVILTNVALAVLLEKVIEDPEEGREDDTAEPASPEQEAKDRKSQRRSSTKPSDAERWGGPPRVMPHSAPSTPGSSPMMIKPPPVDDPSRKGGNPVTVVSTMSLPAADNELSQLRNEVTAMAGAMRSLQEELAAMRKEQRELLLSLRNQT